MQSQQLRPSNPITSKTMWALYSGQLALSIAFWQLVHVVPAPAEWLFAWALLLIATLPIIGVLGLVGLDRIIFAGVAVASSGRNNLSASSKGSLGRALARLLADRGGRGDA